MRVLSLLIYVAFAAFIVVLLYYAEEDAAPPPPPAPMPEEDVAIPPPAPPPASAEVGAPETPPAAEPPLETTEEAAEPVTPPVTPPPAPPEQSAEAEPPPAPPTQEPGGEPLPTASDFDPNVWVTVPVEAVDAIGSGFTVAEGVWMTARHVVEGCSRVGLVVQGDNDVLASAVAPAENADVAVVRAPLERTPLAVDLDESDRRLGDSAFLIGFPQGVPGEVATKLLGRARMQVRGRYSTSEPVLAWAETSRTQGITGSLGGLSGGPAIDAGGAAIGVVVAEAPRRGRIYTAAPSSLAAALDHGEAAPAADAPGAGALSEASYGVEGRRLRRALRVAKIDCLVDAESGD